MDSLGLSFSRGGFWRLFIALVFCFILGLSCHFNTANF